jgi:O-antigen/teichoic acid export membrane protein
VSAAPKGPRLTIYQELLRHSGVYGIGLLLSRFASFLLLPLYTSYLSPRDYGIIALLDLGSAVLGQISQGGIPAAVLRESYNPKFQSRSEKLWSTGLFLIIGLTLPGVLIAWSFRDPLSRAVFGPEVTLGPRFIELAAWIILPQALSNYMQAYVRALKRSTLFVTMSVSGLIVRIALNVAFIAGMRFGVLGFLYSSLIASTLEMLAYGIILFGRKRWGWIGEIVPTLLRYGVPIVIAGLSALAMHQMNRAILRGLDVDLASIGLFALAYTIAQAGSTLVLDPFHAIWSPLMFEADRQADRLQVFRRVFIGLVCTVFLMQLGIALASRPLIHLVAAPDYFAAADLLPWLCLAFFFFPLHTMFRIPVMLHRKTERLALIALVAAAVNCLLNLLLIPRFHVLGACWASIGTYATFSFAGYALYQRTENLRFPLHIIAGATLIGVAVFLPYGLLLRESSWPVQVLGGFTLWILGGALLLRMIGWLDLRRWTDLWRELRGRRTPAAPGTEEPTVEL